MATSNVFERERKNVQRMFAASAKVIAMAATLKVQSAKLEGLVGQSHQSLSTMQTLMDDITAKMALFTALFAQITNPEEFEDLSTEIATIAIQTQLKEVAAASHPGFVASILNVVELETLQNAVMMLKDDKRTFIYETISKIQETGFPSGNLIDGGKKNG